MQQEKEKTLGKIMSLKKDSNSPKLHIQNKISVAFKISVKLTDGLTERKEINGTPWVLGQHSSFIPGT